MADYNYLIATENLKKVKIALPNDCTFLSLVKNQRTQVYYVQAHINKEVLKLSVPSNLAELTETDYERIYKLILEQCPQQN